MQLCFSYILILETFVNLTGFIDQCCEKIYKDFCKFGWDIHFYSIYNFAMKTTHHDRYNWIGTNQPISLNDHKPRYMMCSFTAVASFLYLICWLYLSVFHFVKPFTSIIYSSSLPMPVPVELYIFHKFIIRNPFALHPLIPPCL